MKPRGPSHPRLLPLGVAIVLTALCVPGCAGGNDPEASSRGRPCAGSCESNLWPRLVVGVTLAGEADRDATEMVTSDVVLEDGTILPGHLRGCPEIPGILCSYSFFTAPRDRTVTLLLNVREPSGLRTEARIALAPFNPCGREITYVSVTVAPGSAPRVGESRRISPCERSGTASP